MEKLGNIEHGAGDGNRTCPECHQPLNNDGFCESYLFGCKNFGKQMAEPLKRQEDGQIDFHAEEYDGEKKNIFIDKEKISLLAERTTLDIVRISSAAFKHEGNIGIDEIKKYTDETIARETSANNLNVASIIFLMEKILEEISKLSSRAILEKAQFFRFASSKQEDVIRQLNLDKKLTSRDLLKAINKSDDDLKNKKEEISRKINMLTTIRFCVEDITKEKKIHFQKLGIL